MVRVHCSSGEDGQATKLKIQRNRLNKETFQNDLSILVTILEAEHIFLVKYISSTLLNGC